MTKLTKLSTSYYGSGEGGDNQRKIILKGVEEKKDLIDMNHFVT